MAACNGTTAAWGRKPNRSRKRWATLCCGVPTACGPTDVVRGEDLADNTPRQILLHNALGLPTPRYLHTPLVCGANGEKLSKQNGAQALDLTDPVVALSQAAQALGLPALATLAARLKETR